MMIFLDEIRLPQGLILKKIDYEKEGLEEENKNLKAAWFMSKQLSEIQNDFDQELSHEGLKLVKSNNILEEATENSGETLNDTKKKAK